MPSPTRPVAGAAVATDWGQAVHDYTFAPSGCRAHSGAAVTMVAHPTYTALNLDVVDSDPGGYVDTANDRIIIPSGGAGLYLLFTQWNTDEGDIDEETRVNLLLNDAQIGSATIRNDGSVAVAAVLDWGGVLVEGDILRYQARQNGTGDRANVRLESVLLLRVGNELGGA